MIKCKKEPCIECNGEGRIIQEMPLHQPCRKCRGEGNIEWIDNLTPIKNKAPYPDKEIIRKIIQHNYHLLVMELNNQLRQIGAYAQVEVIFDIM